MNNKFVSLIYVVTILAGTLIFSSTSHAQRFFSRTRAMTGCKPVNCCEDRLIQNGSPRFQPKFRSTIYRRNGISQWSTPVQPFWPSNSVTPAIVQSNTPTRSNPLVNMTPTTVPSVITLPQSEMLNPAIATPVDMQVGPNSANPGGIETTKKVNSKPPSDCSYMYDVCMATCQDKCANDLPECQAYCKCMYSNCINNVFPVTQGCIRPACYPDPMATPVPTPTPVEIGK